MPTIGINLTGIHEPKPVPNGEYALTIASAEFREEKNDVRVDIGIDEHLDAPNITHFISLPKDEDDERKADFKRRMLKRFLVAFQIPHEDDGFDPDDFAGCSATLALTLTEPNDAGNVYNRIVLPYLPDEEDTPKAKKGAAAAKRPPKR